MIPLAILLAAIGFVDVAAILKPRFNLPEFSWTVIAVGTVFSLLSSLPVLYYQPRLMDMGPSYAFDRLSRDPAPCGVALYRFGWIQSGGYAHLHRTVRSSGSPPAISSPSEPLPITPSSRRHSPLICPQPSSSSSVPMGFVFISARVLASRPAAETH